MSVCVRGCYSSSVGLFFHGGIQGWRPRGQAWMERYSFTMLLKLKRVSICLVHCSIVLLKRKDGGGDRHILCFVCLLYFEGLGVM